MCARCMKPNEASLMPQKRYAVAPQTIPYMPPELLEDAKLSPLVDVYSFGIIMWECFTGQVRACAAGNPLPVVESSPSWANRTL